MTALADLSGLLVLFQYLQLLLNETIPQNSLIFFIQKFFYTSNLNLLLGYLLLVIFLIKTLLIIKVNNHLIKFFNFKIAEKRYELTKSIFSLDYLGFKKNNITNYIDIFFRQINISISGTLMPLIKIMGESIIYIILVIYLLYLNPYILISTILFLTTFFFFYDFLFKKKLKSIGSNVNYLTKKLIQILKDGLEAINEIKLYDKQNFIYNEVKDISYQIAYLQKYPESLRINVKYLLEFLVVFIFVMIIGLIILLDISFVSAIPTLAVFSYSYLKLSGFFNSILGLVSGIRENSNTIEILEKNLNKFSTYVDDQIQSKYRNIKFNSISYKSLYFKYPESRDYILEDVSLEIKNNKIYGIVGKSGVGKTTMINILMGLLPFEKGTIYLNGELYDKNNYQNLSKYFSIVPQKVFLMNKTIAENISLANTTSKKKILDCIKSSHFYIDQESVNLDQIISDSGANLSGGQAQRLGIARALYHKKRIIILDEPTSSLDKDTEKNIISTLNDLKKEYTLIIISHNEDIIKICDEVFFLKDKRLKRKV